MSTKRMLDKAIRSLDDIKKSNDAQVKIEYDDALGDTHMFIKSSVEEAKKWIDEGKFPHGKAFNVKIDGKLYKKQVMGR